ncbi:hypothetical protein K402DRAFT_451986 [Aulographum hederae CBS 113979]|uniref:Uncharacterized protein n=1 Tax=Aulographum hederae CBS 113979 TaxID=1176131 RepID=A0A6G1H9W9_9PEZI|nr:hypothetical protein K402DRAFT_451986 [Aulographum hederae CBS 113979]
MKKLLDQGLFEPHSKLSKAAFERSFYAFPPLDRLSELGFADKLRSVSILITPNACWEPPQAPRVWGQAPSPDLGSHFAEALFTYLDGLHIPITEFYFQWEHCPAGYRDSFERLVKRLNNKE